MASKTTALAGLGALAAAAGVLLAAAPASAHLCPRHTSPQTYYVAGQPVNGCRLDPDCLIPTCDTVAPTD